MHPAGWYPSPTETNLLRYWNGAAWTSYTQPRTGNPGDPIYPPGSYPQPVQAVAATSPAVSVLVSFFLPGVGSMINGNVGTGIAILALWLISFPLVFVLDGFVTGIVCLRVGPRRRLPKRATLERTPRDYLVAPQRQRRARRTSASWGEVVPARRQAPALKPTTAVHVTDDDGWNTIG